MKWGGGGTPCPEGMCPAGMFLELGGQSGGLLTVLQSLRVDHSVENPPMSSLLCQGLGILLFRSHRGPRVGTQGLFPMTGSLCGCHPSLRVHPGDQSCLFCRLRIGVRRLCCPGGGPRPRPSTTMILGLWILTQVAHAYGQRGSPPRLSSQPDSEDCGKRTEPLLVVWYSGLLRLWLRRESSTLVTSCVPATLLNPLCELTSFHSSGRRVR